MKYYLHDANSFNDEKICRLFMKHGFEGVGLFYTLLEKLAQQEKPVSTTVLKMQLHIGKKLEKIWQFMEDIELIHSKNGETFNENLLRFSEKYQIKKEKNRERVARFREQRPDSEPEQNNVTHYTGITNCERNADKVKESKIRESKEKQAFVPPVVEDVVSYFKEHNYSEEIARKAHAYYDGANWKDSKGNQVTDWKRKMLNVWFKPENKITQASNYSLFTPLEENVW
jgi:hypothetical protein